MNSKIGVLSINSKALYTHCSCHRLNLAVVAPVESNTSEIWWQILTLFAKGELCPQQILLFLGASGILRKWNFQRINKIHQGFWIKKPFFQKSCI